MHLREATRSDFPSIGDIQAICSKTDTIARYFIKDMDKYPTTCHHGSTRFCKRRAAVPGSVTFVIETEPSDYVASERYRALEVVGFVIWHRIGDSTKAKQWQARNQGLWTSLNGVLDAVEDRYLGIFTGVNRTYRPDLFQQILPILSIPFDKDVFAEAWEVSLFFVHPMWQRRRIGRKLLQWGFDAATEEKVPIVVKSSALGNAAYQACGFEKLGEIGLDAVFDTREFGGDEPALWIWEPEGCKGMWYERGREALQKWKSERAAVET